MERLLLWIRGHLQEPKKPVIDSVTAAGCHWQPLAWNAPKTFRWLTE